MPSIMNSHSHSRGIPKLGRSRTSSPWIIENIGSINLEIPNISFQNAVNAVWAVVVWNYTGLEDISFLTANTGKKDGKISYSVCETHLDGTTTLFDLVQDVKHKTRDIKLEEIQSSIPSNSPLMNIITIFSTQREENADKTLTSLDLGATAGELLVVECGDTMDVSLHLNNFPSAQLDQEQADRLAAAFAHVMNLVTRGHGQDRLDFLDLVSDHDKATLWDWNGAQLPETVHACVHSLFRQQVREQADEPAVDSWDGSFTYSELDTISDRIAAKLSREEGVRPESIVPLCFDKSCWAIAALMGVVKAGGAIVFIDPANPVSRRRDVMDEIGARFVITSRDQAARWENEMGVRAMIVDKEFVEGLEHVEEVMIDSDVTPENLVYLIFTSGSTGKPKGCLIQHRAFVSGALQHAAKSNLTRGSRVMQLASYSFDVSMLEILTSLISGACVCTPNMASIAQGLSPIVNGLGITWAFLTPSLVKLLRPEDVPGLKTLALGGEPLHKADIETWAPHLQLINGYGPSECSVAAAGDPSLKPTSDPSNIGRAVGGLCWVVDAENHDRLVPIGAVGELLISGPILARGYLNDAEKTAASFIEGPKWTEGWSLAQHETDHQPMRFYKTGDLAKFNSDGTIQLLGRKDTQVKLRGLRVELGEIEHNMAAHTHVKHVAAFLPKSGPCREKIIAVLSLHELTTTNPGIDVVLESQSPRVKDQVDAVQTHLRACVPEYMVPALCIVIENWPLLASAKLNRKRVANWLVGMENGLYNTLMGFLTGESNEEKKLSEVEHTLRDMFARALKTPANNVPLDQSFISLGGDSLAAMRMVGECRSVGLTGIKMEDILKSQGITHLAGSVDQHSSSATLFDTPFPLSRAQRAYFSKFSGDKTENETSHDNQSLLLNLHNAVSPAQLEASLGAVVARHHMMRVRFPENHDSQIIPSKVEGSFRFEAHGIEQAEELSNIIAMAQRTVTLMGPVFSADFIRIDGRQLLFMVGHRAVVDSVSWGIVVTDLETCLANDGSSFLDQDRPNPFQSWVSLELSTEEVEGVVSPAPELSYWAMQGRPNFASETVEQTVNLDEVTASLLLDAKVHKALRTDAQDFLLASMLYTFGHIFSDRGEPTISVWENGRSGPGSNSTGMNFSATVGQFERTRPLVVDINTSNAKSDIVSMLKRIKDARRLRVNTANAQISEIYFRYQDLSHILDRPNTLVKREPCPPFLESRHFSETSGNNVRQPHLISIVAEVIGNGMQISFSHNRHMSQRVRIWSWIAAAQKTLASLITKMLVAPVDYSLSDFPLLLPALTYDGLDKLLHERLPRSGLGHAAISSIEDMYPCSPMQQDLLISQSRASNEGMYEHYHISEVRLRHETTNTSVDASQLAKAWEQVVQRHPSLRTVFVESSLSEDSGHGHALFDQVVLTQVQPTMSIIDCHSDAHVNNVFAKQSPVSFRGPQPPHRLIICRVAGKQNRLVVKLDVNHAIVDGGSIAVMLRDLILAYDGQAILSKPAFPFRNYISYIRQTPIDPSLEFWVNYLDGQTPTMFPRLAGLEVPPSGPEKRRLNEVVVPLDNVSGEGLSNFCQHTSVTRATVFQAAWALVLGQYTESSDGVCFGYLSAGRDADLHGIEDGVGAFLTMLTCRVRFNNKKLNKSTRLDHLVRAVAEDYTNCLPHQHVGLSNIQHALKTGGSPLFNTIIAFNREPEGVPNSSVVIQSLQVFDPDEYAITVDIRFAGQHGVNVSLRHWTDSLTADQAYSVASAFGRAVEVIVHSAANSTPGDDISLVSNYHRDKLLSFNTHELPRADRLMFTKFEEYAQTQPDAQAVCAWDGTWTYRELDDMSTNLAHLLRTLGVGPEVIVPYCFQKSGWAVVTCMAILKAGGAFVGLDPSHPKQRLWKLVDDINAKIVCVVPQNAQLFTDMERRKQHDGITIVTVTPEFVAQLSPKPGRPCRTVRPDNAACVVFTSGTTGRPKAIVIEHASMASTSDLMGPILGIGPESRVFQFASYTFDVSNQDVFTTLQRGGCVCVPSEEDRVNDPAGAIERLQANFANLTSTMMGLIGRPDRVPSLKRLVNLGEPLARENVGVWAPAVELYNTYGPAEASVSITCSPERMTVHSSSPNIGKSYGCWSWVVDAADYHELVPIGAVGELLIEGPLLARHYYNNPHKTAESFVENPRWAQKMTPGRERRLYRTGDLCRFNSDGSLSIIGRRDTQVKIHGQRVELDDIAYEIQGQLGGHRSLVSVDALVLNHQQNTKKKTLVAFMQFLDRTLGSSDDNKLAIPMSDSLFKELTDLHRALKARLPGHMIPTMFIPITATPRTANGKLAREVLRDTVAGLSETDISRYMLKGDYMDAANVKISPSTPQEKTLQDLWSKVLGVPVVNISTDDVFFQLGGDSVMAMRLVGAARAEHVSLTVADIFRFPGLADMARAIRTEDEDAAHYEEIQFEDSSDQARQGTKDFDLVVFDSSAYSLDSIRQEAAAQCGVPPEQVVEMYPCTPLQQGLMALSTRQMGAYKAQRTFRLTNPHYDIKRLQRAVDAVVRAEAILRTRIVNAAAAGLLQAVLDKNSPSSVAWIEREGDLAAYLKEDMETPVRYGSPLLRLALITTTHCEKQQQYIVWSAHHVLYDGFSMDVTFEQIAYALEQIHAGTAANGMIKIKPKPAPFKNFIRYLHDQARDMDDGGPTRMYWTRQFPASGEAPASYPITPNTRIQQQHMRHHLTRWAQLKVPRGNNGINKTSLANYLRAAWGLVVARHLDSPDILLAVTLSGRNAPGVEGISTMNGPTITTVPFRMAVDLEGDTTVETYLASIQAQAEEMVPFEHAGLQNIRRLNERARAAVDDLAHLFVVQPSVLGGELAFEGTELVPAELAEFYTDPLVIRNHAHSDGETVDVEVKYDEAVISDAQMQRLLNQYSHVVRQLCSVQENKVLVRDVQVLSPEDLVEIKMWNGAPPQTVQKCVHELVAEQTAKRPDAQAVCAWDGNYTFREVNKTADKLATELHSLGVGPEVTVALCFDKSKWNVVAMMAVLKAGGCYTSISPVFPAARVRDMLDDVEASLVLCSPQHTDKFIDVVSLPRHRILAVDQLLVDSLPTPATPTSSSVQPSNAAFIVFTSGSTGRPKGAIIEHRGICSMQHYEGPHVDIGPDTRTLQFASHIFDVSNSEVFTTLMRGGCVCVPSEEERLNDLAGAINKYRVNWSFQVPTTADTLDPDHLPDLKCLALGGEPIRQGLVDRWAGRVKLLNSYGPSECSIWTSVSHIPPGSTSPNNIGRGLGCRTWITDKNDHNKLVPIGCVGELCVEGPIVTRGYKSRPEQTAAAYVENPAFAKTLGIESLRMYKTGDLVRYETDGTLLYVGRKGSQVKIRGQRIELSEIEHVIVSSGGYKADGVAVEKVVLQNSDGGVDLPEQVALAAFLKLGDLSESGSDSGYASSPMSGDISDEYFSLAISLPEESEQRQQLVELRGRLLDAIPPHMVPSFFIPLRRMPVTQTGKKDRKALRELGASLSKGQRKQYALVDTTKGSLQRGDSGRPCTTDAEKELRILWAQVLDIADEQTISADDNFFLKGGDSIQAMRLASAARRVGKTLAVADMFRLPRLYQMATLLATTAGGQYDVVPFSLIQPHDIDDVVSDAARQCNVSEQEIQDIYPCTPLQEGLMAVSTQQTQVYVSTRVFEIGKDIDITRLKAAWQNAADVFPILRTRIVLGRDSESLQVVLSSEKLSWESIAITNSTDINLLPRVEYGGRLFALAIDDKVRKLVWAVHHTVYDGWSATILLSAVEKIYKGADPRSLAGPAFNLFIRHLSQTVDTTESADFWRSQLSDASGSSPAHFPKLSNTTREPKASAEFCYSFQLPASSQEKAAGILKTTLLKAAWAMVTARHAESSDIAFGVAQSGRDCPVPGIDEMVGPVVTTVPVRVRIDHSNTVESFLAQVQEQSVAMIAHQHAGLQAIRRLGKEVQAALEFKSLFVFQQDSAEGLYGHSGDFITEVSSPELMKGFYPYPIVIECTLAGDGLTVNMLARHDLDIVPTHQMGWLCKQFGHVVGQLASSAISATMPLGDVDFISPEDLATIRGWNALSTHQDLADDEIQTVDEAIAEQVRIRPNDLALTGWDGDMTYAELDNYTTRLAKSLVSKWGVGPEVMVPLCFDKSKWAIVASLAVVKAGGAFAHLSPTQPLERRKDILHATKSEFVLVSPQHVSLFDTVTIQTVPIDRETMDLMHTEDSQVQLLKTNFSNAVYVSFTSGSTGKPKGIVVEHRNLRMSARAHGSQLMIGPGTRVFQFSAYTFDIGLGDIFISLQRGATICTPSEWERLNDLSGAITKYLANWLSATPSVVSNMLSPEAVPTLRTLAIGGESPTEENIKTWSANLDLVVWWGPTETTIYASATPPIKVSQDNSSSVAPHTQRLGTPMGCRMWLCDPSDHNKLTPLGCVGEIVVEGPLVSRGYLDEGKTVAAFVQDVAWSIDRESRMYKTGDLARYDADGCMLFLGRKDTQIKLHGQRIELGEIEHGMLVLASETVRQAVARVPREGPLRGKLVAMTSFHQSGFSTESSDIVVLDTQDADRHVAVVRRILQDNLTSYMIPAVFVCVQTIPLNQNAKVDRKLVDTWLEQLDQATYQSLLQREGKDDQCRPPSTRTENIVWQTISRILDIDAESPNMNRSFLSLGGDSITAMKLRSQARTQGIAVTMQDIIKSKSLVELAEKAKFTEPSPSEAEVPGAPFSLSPIQKMFFDTVGSSSSEDMAHFSQSFLLQINRPVTPESLREAIGAAVSRHTMLRARFARNSEENSGGEWYQYLTDYDATTSFNFTVSDLLEREQLSEMLGTSQQHVFDLGKGPLFAAHLFNFPSARQQFLFVRAHHLVVDVVSWHVLLGDLEMYLVTGHSRSAPPPALTFQTWLRLQKDMVESFQPSEVLPEFQDIPAPDFGYWGMKDEPNTYGDVIESGFLLDEPATSKLLTPTLNTSPVDIILAALMHSFVSVFPDHDAPTIFSEGHGREIFGTNRRIDVSNTVGWFTTITPLHVPSANSKDISEIVRSVTETRQQVPANGMPYFASRYLTGESGKVFGSHSKMEILFNYLGRSQESDRRNDALLSAAELSQPEMILIKDQSPRLPRFALFDISAEITGNKTRVSFIYNKKMQRQGQIEQWVAKAQAALRSAVEVLSILSPEDMSTPLVNGKLDNELSKQVIDMGVTMKEVQEVYPCIPMQAHMLAARQKYPDRRLYEMELSYNITTKEVVDLNRLRTAWQKVVHRHTILRTILVPITTEPESLSWQQVVLRNFPVHVPVIECADETDMRSCIEGCRSVQYNTLQSKPNHQLTLFAIKHEKVACKLEIDHTLTDGVSIALMLDDLALAYEDKLPLSPAPSFGSYASWLHQQHPPRRNQIDQETADVSYWKSFIQSSEGATPIPHLINTTTSPPAQHKIQTIHLNQNTLATNLPTFCAKHNITPAAFFQTAWGLVLQKLTHSNKSLFGYMTANRDGDGDVEGMESMAGPVVNMLLCRTDTTATNLDDENHVGDLLRKSRDDFLASLEHQYGLAKVEELQMGMVSWNSVMSLQYADSWGLRRDGKHDGGISFDMFAGRDPNVWDVTFGVQISSAGSRRELVAAQLGYWSHVLSEDAARDVGLVFGEVVDKLMFV